MREHSENTDRHAVYGKATTGCVDVHHHFYPQFLMDAWKNDPTSENEWGSYKALFMQDHYLKWTPERTVDLLDEGNVATAVLSLPTGIISRYTGAEARPVVRRCNEFAIRMADDYPGRFGLFTMLPMPDIEGSLEEIAYGFDHLKADGVALMTSYGNRWLGHPDFAPVLEELNRRKIVVHVHPKSPPCCSNLVHSNPWGAASLLEFPYDTGRTVFDLLQSGSFLKFRDINWVFSHCGGVLPMLAGRLRDVGPGFWRDFDLIAPHGFDYELRRLNYDTAASAYAPCMNAILSYVPESQIVFGTDFPHYSVAKTAALFADLDIPEETKIAIQRDNPRRLLSRLK